MEFADLDAAYLDAFRAAGEIWLEMSSRGEDGSRHCFEITDISGLHLIELPFSEVLHRTCGRRTSGRSLNVVTTIDATATSRRLANEIASLVAAAKKTLEQTQRVLQRSRYGH